MLFREFLKPHPTHPLIQLFPIEQEILLDSNRLQSTLYEIQSVLSKCCIQNLMIYHHPSNSSINDMPCIIYGDSQLAHSHKHIVHSIHQELANSAKNLLTISRNGQSFHVLPLMQNNMKKGMVYYTTTLEGGVDNAMISDCLIPLLLRS